MRLLLVGAFPYPASQGSQIYFQEQAIALRSLGAEISLATYGADSIGAPQRIASTGLEGEAARASEYWRALDGFDHHRSAGWTAPSRSRSGPSWAKPLADLGLIMTLRDAVALNQGDDAFDAILTHNMEATLAALHGLPDPRPPILYCVHTLVGQELSAYLRGPKTNSILAKSHLFDPTGPIARRLDRLGARLDDWTASRVDGWLALTRSADCVMRQSSNAPGSLVRPAVPDPLTHRARLDPETVARRHDLEPGRFLIYSGNLDGYQELDILSAAAARLARGENANRTRNRTRLVIASHSDRSVAGWTDDMPGVEFRRVKSSAEMQALMASARASLLLRRTEGGFPIKLANSLAAGTPAIAFQEREWGLQHNANSLICSPTNPVESLVAAIERIAKDDLLARRLARGARDLYLEKHQPDQTAKQVWALIEEVRRRRPAR